MIAARRHHPLTMLLLGLLLLAAGLASLASGTVTIHPLDTLRALGAVFGWAEVPAEVGLIVEHIRLPRMLMGLLVGATLALTGAVMQGLFRNPLADPGLIGVSSGAALGAALMIVLEAHCSAACLRGSCPTPR